MFSYTFQQHCKTYHPHFQFQLNCGTLENVQIPSSRPYINSCASLNKTSSSVFNLTLEHIQLDNFCLWNCLRTPNAYRIVAQKVFLFQMLGETTTFTLPGKVPLGQKCQNDVLCGNTNMDVSPYILKFWILLQKYLFYNDCLESCWSIVVKKWNYMPSKEVCLIIIQTQHIF